jgi:hypothetical protein
MIILITIVYIVYILYNSYIMITITQEVERLINQSPYLREALSDDLINHSALTRKILPTIRKSMGKLVSDTAVLIAVQRYAKAMTPYYNVNPADYLDNLSLESDLFELTVASSDTLLSAMTFFQQKYVEGSKGIVICTIGRYEASIVASVVYRENLLSILSSEKILSTIPDLVGITLRRTFGQVETTGVLQFHSGY